MKLITTYCLLLAWSGYFALGLFGNDKTLIAHSEHEKCHVSPEKAFKDDCCTDSDNTEKDNAQSNNDDEEKDCCATSDCPRTCCNISIANLTLPGEFTFTIIRPLLTFGSFANPFLPKPYLGRVYPPPNLWC